MREVPDDVRLSFDAVARRYDEIRPHYPPALFDELFSAMPPDPEIVEVGPGTGQATGDLLQRGARVTAVEFGASLAAMLADNHRSSKRLKVLNQSFEQAALPVACFDAVVSATAYHWVEREARAKRPLELLRTPGVLAVIDLIQVDVGGDRDYFDRVTPIYRRFGQPAGKVRPPSHHDANPAIAAELAGVAGFSTVDVVRFPWDQSYTSEQYRSLLLTYSGTRMMAPDARSRMVDELVAVIDDEFDGYLLRPLVATLTLAFAR